MAMESDPKRGKGFQNIEYNNRGNYAAFVFSCRPGLYYGFDFTGEIFGT
jgi:hypothetical protein